MIELEFRNADFYGEGKPENAEKTLEARERINNKLNSHEVPEPRIERVGSIVVVVVVVVVLAGCDDGGGSGRW
jgi:hypothetical protein